MMDAQQCRLNAIKTAHSAKTNNSQWVASLCGKKSLKTPVISKEVAA